MGTVVRGLPQERVLRAWIYSFTFASAAVQGHPVLRTSGEDLGPHGSFHWVYNTAVTAESRCPEASSVVRREPHPGRARTASQGAGLSGLGTSRVPKQPLGSFFCSERLLLCPEVRPPSALEGAGQREACRGPDGAEAWIRVWRSSSAASGGSNPSGARDGRGRFCRAGAGPGPCAEGGCEVRARGGRPPEGTGGSGPPPDCPDPAWRRALQGWLPLLPQHVPCLPGRVLVTSGAHFLLEPCGLFGNQRLFPSSSPSSPGGGGTRLPGSPPQAK